MVRTDFEKLKMGATSLRAEVGSEPTLNACLRTNLSVFPCFSNAKPLSLCAEFGSDPTLETQNGLAEFGSF